MRHFFLDTNVVFDYLARREPFGLAAAALFEAAFQGQATLYVSSLSFSHVFYTTRKLVGAAAAREMLQKLTRFVQIVAIDSAIVHTALGSGITDVEDAMQFLAALAIPDITHLVTRDPRGFVTTSRLLISSPTEAVRSLIVV